MAVLAYMAGSRGVKQFAPCGVNGHRSGTPFVGGLPPAGRARLTELGGGYGPQGSGHRIRALAHGYSIWTPSGSSIITEQSLKPAR